MRYTSSMKCCMRKQGCNSNATGTAIAGNVTFILCDVHLAVAKTKKDVTVKFLATVEAAPVGDTS